MYATEEEVNELKAKLWGSFKLFIQTFFPLVTGKDFHVSTPPGRESHFITVARELVAVSRLQTNSLIINMPPGYGKPLCGETLVVTKGKGRVKLKDIEIGNHVLTHTGNYRKVVNKFNQGILPTLKIKTFCGRELISAYDHTFLTAKGWKQAKDLEIDDVLGSCKPNKLEGQYVSNETARLLGYFIGDGCLSGSSCNITCADQIETKDIERCCEKLGFIYKSQKYNLKNRKEHHSKELVRINISNARKWLKEHYLEDKNSYTKRVPEAIMKGTEESIMNFLGAYYACDGTLSGKGKDRGDMYASITSVSRQLLEDAQYLFNLLGIRSRIRKKISNINTKKQGEKYISYNLDISSQDDLYNFQRLIPIYHSKGNVLKSLNIRRMRFNSEILPDSIVEIEKNEQAHCYCLEVEEDHTFTANDIIVHNSTLVSYWVAWTLSRYPDSQFLYISYGKHLAAKHTEIIRRIILTREYRELFDIEVREDSKAKDSFLVKNGGSIKAFGSSGPITGQDAGLPNQNRFTGAVIMDDMHKPDEVHSDTVREGVIQNYRETILQRPRGPNVPMVFIGQCLHEADLAAYLKSGKDEREWKTCVLKALDEAGNALYPEVNSVQSLLDKKEKNPYVFASQFQQDPIPSGGALFKRDYFPVLKEEPKILLTFITADTAETDKTYNDATVFSFWGIYNIVEGGFETGQMGLHWLDCMEVRIEPKDLRSQFMSFYQSCMQHKIKPLIAAIEKKSTGVTLISVLQEMRGLRIIEIERTSASGSKANRFLEIQPILAAKMLSFTEGARHYETVISHMAKITANDSHRWDDICDTCADACRLALIDKVIRAQATVDDHRERVLDSMASHFNMVSRARTNALGVR